MTLAITTADRFTPTEFGDNLFVYHKIMYKILRASLPLYLDKVANERLSLWIIAKEFRLKEDERAKRLDKGVRIPWADIKDFVLSTICRVTLGSYKYLPLHQLKREDDMLFASWVSAVKEIVTDVKNHGNGWEQIIDPEALHVLHKWLSDPERNQLDQHLVNKGLHLELQDIGYMVRNVSFDKFVETFINVSRDKLPKKFRQSKAKEALNSTILTYAEAEEMVKQKTAKLQREITSLKAEVANLKTHKRKQPETSGKDRNPKRSKGPKADKKDKEDSKDYEPTLDEYPNVPIGKHGQCKPGCCQRCHNLGLKNRSHGGRACDPIARQKAVEKAKKKRQRRQENKDDNNRKITFLPTLLQHANTAFSRTWTLSTPLITLQISAIANLVGTLTNTKSRARKPATRKSSAWLSKNRPRMHKSTAATKLPLRLVPPRKWNSLLHAEARNKSPTPV